jgi:glucokinase
MDEYFLGIDVGGTNVKVGLVKADGSLVSKQKFPTSDLREGNNFVEKFVQLVDTCLQKFPEVERVGIGIPGVLTRKRKSTIDLANLPEFNGVKLHRILTEAFEGKKFYMENDANAAALGEYYFSGRKLPSSFIFITLGTGIGGAAIIRKKLFKGGGGNSMEVGHIMAGNGKSLENLIGKEGIVQITRELLKTYKGETLLTDNPDLDADSVEDAARQGDALAQQVFNRVGTLLGEGLVSVVRLLDVNNIVVGGGVSKVFEHVRPNMEKALREYLPSYYTEKMNITLAVLGNNAGIIGAASLCLKKARE